jgi:threonine dehydrogenase-like Zn-dependent dehydrogenase
MKAIQVMDGREVALLDLPVPAPGPGEVLVRVEAVTTCPQWDLHLRHNEPMFVGHVFRYPYMPGQPGHEATGEVEAVGAGVKELEVGDRVSVWRDPGHDVPGCYAQFVVRRQEDVLRVPRDLPYEATASLELAMCVGATFLRLKAMDALRERRVGVSGLGPAGLIAGQMARAEGAASVTGFDLSAQRREHARRHGFDAVYDPREDLAARFPARPPHLGGPWKPGLECGVDCVGAKASVEFLMDRVAETVALFGVQREDYTFAPRHWISLCLVGYPRHTREAAQYALGLLEGGQLDLTALVTHHLPLERYAEGIDLLERQEAIKVCFWPWREA